MRYVIVMILRTTITLVVLATGISIAEDDSRKPAAYDARMRIDTIGNILRNEQLRSRQILLISFDREHEIDIVSRDLEAQANSNGLIQTFRCVDGVWEIISSDIIDNASLRIFSPDLGLSIDDVMKLVNIHEARKYGPLYSIIYRNTKTVFICTEEKGIVKNANGMQYEYELRNNEWEMIEESYWVSESTN